MANNTYNISEIVGTSPDGLEAAITNAVTEAGKTVRNLDWFELQSVRGHLEDGKIADWQATVKIGFRHDG
ncbi:dodecin [Citricoccus nitrophenolicus]|uniref:dodecin n=1 Tax=Citricoccus nitrophenolicus TaxID=863575 RepID=UPI0031EBDC03